MIPLDTPLETQQYVCFNGPCQGSQVSAPTDATPGTACALPWKTVHGKPRYAVYVLVDWNGTHGLMFVRSYQQAHQAQWKVDQLSLICAAQTA